MVTSGAIRRGTDRVRRRRLTSRGSGLTASSSSRRQSRRNRHGLQDRPHHTMRPFFFRGRRYRHPNRKDLPRQSNRQLLSDMQLVEVEVMRLGLDRTNNSYVVILKEKEGERLL